MDAKECREAFEAWAKSEDYDLTLNGNGDYFYLSAHDAWKGYRTAWNRRADAQEAADAKRYRWLRNTTDANIGDVITGEVKAPKGMLIAWEYFQGIKLDAAIDAAIAGEKKE